MDKIIQSLNTIEIYLSKKKELLQSVLSKYAVSERVDGKIIGTGQSDFTKDSKEYSLISGEKEFILIDVPGIEGDESKYEDIIKKALNKAHLVLYVNGSSKKEESRTVEKIKSYLRNDSDVYAVINTHCLGMANREVDIDGTYIDSLKEAYKKDMESVLPQTEEELTNILSKNYKGGILINGLLAFSSLSYNQEKGSSICYPDDKGLIQTQSNFLKEFSSDINQMKQQSHIYDLKKIIDDHEDGFKDFIVESNKKKLLARLNDSFTILDEIKIKSSQIITNFTRSYQSMSKNVLDAADEFSDDMDTLIPRSVEPVITSKLNLFYKFIEDKKGKIKKEDYETFFDGQKESLKAEIENKFKSNFNESLQEYKEKIEEAKRRFSVDIANNVKNTSLTLSDIQKIDFSSIENAMKYSFNNFKGDLFTIGGSAIGGALAWLAIGGIVGGIIFGAGLLGTILLKFIQYFLSTETRISKAKEKAKEIFNELNIKLCNEVKEKVPLEEIIIKIQEYSHNIELFCGQEIEKIIRTGKILESLVNEISIEKTKLEKQEYGKI